MFLELLDDVFIEDAMQIVGYLLEVLQEYGIEDVDAATHLVRLQ